MIAVIAAHRDAFGGEPIGRVLPIAPSTDDDHVARRAEPAKLPTRAQRAAERCGDSRRVWDENVQLYGVRKVWRRLRREGIEVARCPVARLLRGLGR